jgi:hypothetical protein
MLGFGPEGGVGDFVPLDFQVLTRTVKKPECGYSTLLSQRITRYVRPNCPIRFRLKFGQSPFDMIPK